MTQKPEWFEIVDGDDQVSDFAKPAKAGKRIPTPALLASVAIIVGGAFFANANEEQSANAETVSVASSTPFTSQVDPATTTSTSTNSTTSSSNSSGASASQQNGIQNPATKGGDTPAIGKLPQRGGDDEGEDDDHEGFGEHRERPHGEGRHHGDRLPPAIDDEEDDD